MFARRLEGMSVAGIARGLNERRIPSPGVYDRVRNPHRAQTVWTVRTVAAILANPRYTGRQVWNRQYTDHREAVPGDKRSSLGPVRIWNPRGDWVICPDRTHPALVGDDDFTAAQQITAQLVPADGRQRRYALTGLLICDACGRRLAGHWVNGRPGYRCRHGHTSAHPAAYGAPPWMYWPQDRLVEDVIAVNSELAGRVDANDVAAYLKARDAVIVCGRGSLTIEDTAGAPAPAPVTASAESTGEAETPETTDLGTVEAEEAAQATRRRARRPHERRPRKSKKPQVARNPIRSHGRRDDRYGV
ncbi:recombinase family protein [Actinoplanes sp. NPDC023936]|uniref:recombinase family protein n=1 Tax=Actinoplanes sp. NPDC023936 TaxID=3154910 RepID=UPI0033FB8393